MNELIVGRGIATTTFKITIDRSFLIDFILNDFFQRVDNSNIDLRECLLPNNLVKFLLRDSLNNYCDHLDEELQV